MRHSLLVRLRLHPSPLWVIFEINFFRHLTVAVQTSVLSLYLRTFVDSDAAVGAIFFAGYLAGFFSNLYAAAIIEHFKKRKSLLIALAAMTLVFMLFTVIRHTATVFFLFAVYQFMMSLLVLDIGLYVKHYSNYAELAANEGKLGSLGNLGWVVGPLLGGIIAEQYGYHAVFFLSAFVSIIGLMMFFFVRLDHEDVRFPHSRRFRENIARFFLTPNLRKTYINNAGLGFIYSIWDFLPLLMFSIGAGLPVIGLTKTLMGVTQSIFEYPIGQTADRETGEKKIFIIGYALAAIFTAALGFTGNLRLFIVFFFLAATGTAFLEMTRDSYFFRQVPEKDIELIAVYRTSDALPSLVGQGLAIAVLSVVGVKGWFIIGGALALAFVWNALSLKELRPAQNGPDA